MKIFSKVSVGVLSLALAFSVTSGVSAQTMSYADLIKAFVAAGIISADKAAMATALVSGSASTAFTKDLTVGSSGAEVSALQSAIGVTPATGYFGSITKAAVQKFQASKGISATGFVGPLTRAALNGSSSMTTPVVTTPGTTTVVNSGVEGTLTADRFSISNTTAYEGDSMVPVLAIKLQAKLSDITVQRIKLDLGQSTSIYTKVFKTLYVVDDAGKVVAQADLNSNTVVKNGTQYELTLGGISYVVAKDASKVLTVKGDVYSSIKVADQGSKTFRLTDDGIRGTDGAGIDQYAGSNSVTQSITVTTTLADSATMNLSTNSSNYKTTEIVASNGSEENELDKVAVLAFDLKANKADLDVTDLTVRFAQSGSTATATTAYLYDGSTLLSTETVNSSTGVAAFTDSNKLFTVAKDATKTLTVKADIRTAGATATTISASVAAADVLSENASSESKTTSGSATGENMVIRKVGPVFSLLSKGISVSGTNNSGSTLSTSTITATFSLQVQAVGGDITFGSQASATPMFNFKAYDVAGTEVGGVSSTTGFTIPSSGVVTSGLTNSFTLQENNTVTLNPITVTLDGKTTAGAPRSAIAIAITGVKWIGTVPQTSNFMDGKTEWRTNTQTP